jgi:uncharacterized protein YprB with RNaseH-like and TPR domain
MIADELKRRISTLQRGDGSACRSDGRAAQRPASARSRAGLGEHLPKGAVCRTERGELFVCKAALSEIYSGAAKLLPRYLRAFERARQAAGREDGPDFMRALAHARPPAAAFIDTETAGWHGRPLFLMGMAQLRRGELVLTQYFARNYAEEVGLLSRFAAILPRVKLLVTFNGKAFDWPFVRDRMIYHRIECQPSFAHVDLLHPSRRRWRRELPNCRLQTLERYLCGRWRSGDIPSDQIPQRYHDFVREQDPRIIAPIFHHNRLDLIAMMELFIALVEGKRPVNLTDRAAEPAQENRYV